MNIQAEKIELVKLLLNTNNPKIIKSVKQIFKEEELIDFWDDLSVQQQEEIRLASIEIEQGKVSDYDLFMVKHKK